MKRIIFLVIFLMCISTTLFAQDLITKKSGEDIKAKVLEVNQTEIKFKKTDNPDGPTFTISKSEILMIRYSNGTKDIFNSYGYKESSENKSKVKSSPSFDSKPRFMLGPNVLLPTGDFSSLGAVGVGINGTLIAGIAQDFYFFGELGVNDFLAHSSSLWHIPILAGIRYENKLIAGLGIGASSYFGGGSSNTGFAFSPQIGYSFGTMDLIAKYNSASISSVNISYFSIGTYFKL